MVQLHFKPRREQQMLLAACTTRPAAAPVRPLPGIAAQVLFDLRADDARDTSFAAARALLAMPMHDPAADPQPIAALLDRAKHVRASRDLAFEAVLADEREAAAARYADLAAATWVDEAVGRLIAEKVCFVLDAVAERPELRHDHALLMALARVVAMLKAVEL